LDEVEGSLGIVLSELDKLGVVVLRSLRGPLGFGAFEPYQGSLAGGG
jgi:hypothetical protein